MFWRHCYASISLHSTECAERKSYKLLSNSAYGLVVIYFVWSSTKRSSTYEYLLRLPEHNINKNLSDATL
jgi:hypothetical protein